MREAGSVKSRIGRYGMGWMRVGLTMNSSGNDRPYIHKPLLVLYMVETRSWSSEPRITTEIVACMFCGKYVLA